MLRVLEACRGDRTNGRLVRLPVSGKPIDRRDVYRMVSRIAKSANIPRHISPHSLRHAAITNALDAGVPLRDAQILARHADPRTTEHYDRARVRVGHRPLRERTTPNTAQWAVVPVEVPDDRCSCSRDQRSVESAPPVGRAALLGGSAVRSPPLGPAKRGSSLRFPSWTLGFLTGHGRRRLVLLGTLLRG